MPSGEEKVTVNVNGNVKVTGDLGDNLKFDGEGTVKLANENNVEKNGENITKLLLLVLKMLN